MCVCVRVRFRTPQLAVGSAAVSPQQRGLYREKLVYRLCSCLPLTKSSFNNGRQVCSFICDRLRHIA